MKVLAGILVFLIYAAHLHGQVAEGVPSKNDINKKGWWVPNIKLFEVSNTEEVDADWLTGMKTTYLLPSPRPVVEPVRGKPCEINGLASYSLKGEVFAISWSCVRFGIDPRYGKFYIGANMSYRYVDNDMDGIFETRTISELSLPDVWRKKFGPPPPPKISGK